MKKLPMVSLILGLACSAALLGETIAFRHIASNTPEMHKFSHMIPSVPDVHPGEQAAVADPEPDPIVLPTMRVYGSTPDMVLSQKQADTAEKKAKEFYKGCHLQALEQGGSPDHPFVLVCEM